MEIELDMEVQYSMTEHCDLSCDEESRLLCFRYKESRLLCFRHAVIRAMKGVKITTEITKCDVECYDCYDEALPKKDTEDLP